MASQALQAPQVQDAFRWLEQTSQPSKAHLEFKRFIPPSVVRNHFNKERIKSILTATYDGHTPFGRLARDIVDKGYTLVFLILLRLEKVALINEFTRLHRYSDRFLPFTHADGFPIGVAFEEFQAHQQIYCATPMRGGESRHDDVSILPIIEKEEIAQGSSAIIHRVKIHDEYDELGQDPNVDSSERHIYVTKTFRAAADYEAENRAYERIEAMGMPIESLLKCFGCYTYNDTYVVILEHANRGTWEKFMEEEKPPERPEDKLALWRGLMKLGQAVHRIRIAKGWHQDINPHNIVLHKQSLKGRWAYDAKLVDLALSCFTDGMEASGEALAPDNYGTKAYGAPECYRLSKDSFELGTQRYVPSNVDVFSLGGVLLEAAVWIEEGWDSVQRFRDDRLAEAQRANMEEGIACFHDGSNLLGCVAQKLSSLRSREQQSRRLTAQICDQLIAGMLHANHKHRMSSERLWRQFVPILDAADPKMNKLESATSELRLLDAEPNNPNQVDMNITQPTPGLSGGILSGMNLRSTFTESPPGSPHHRANEMINGLPRIKTIYEPETGESETKAEISTGQHQARGGTRHSPLPRHTTTPVTGLEKVRRPARHGTTGNIQQTARRKRNPRLSVLEAMNIMHDIKDHRQPNYSQEQRDQLAKLNDRDHSFILDNSYSTARCWNEIRTLFKILATILDGRDPDGMELRFTTTTNSNRDFDIQRLFNVVDSTNPAADPNVNRALTEAVRGHRGRLRERPLSVYIMTDGAWDWGPEEILLQLVQELKQSGLERQSIGIQFISFGNDQECLDYLRSLDDMADKERFDLPHDIVDTEPSNGNVMKMLLGSFESSYDNEDTA